MGETYGTENGDLSAKTITDIVKINFDARPGALARDLQLRQPKYNVTAAYCHFGRQPYTKDGLTYFRGRTPRTCRSTPRRRPATSRRPSPRPRTRSSPSGSIRSLARASRDLRA